MQRFRVLLVSAVALACGAACGDEPSFSASASEPQSLLANGGVLIELDLAVSATDGFRRLYDSSSNTTATQEVITNWVAELNSISVPSLSVRFRLVDTSGSLISISSGDALSAADGNPGTLLAANGSWLDSNLGTAEYDVGFVFGRVSSGGEIGGPTEGTFLPCGLNRGTAGYLVVSEDSLMRMDGLAFSLHHFFHAMGANNTYSSNAAFCGSDGRNASTAVEIDSGFSIMGLPTSCGGPGSPPSALVLHSTTLDEVTNALNAAPNCGQRTPVSNALPSIVLSPELGFIPRETPFLLTATASDADGDDLRFSWEQIDVGSIAEVPAGDAGDNPLFRMFESAETPERLIPENRFGSNELELAPTTSRDIHFRLVASDVRLDGGAYRSAQTRVRVAAEHGPFVNTTPATAWTFPEAEVTWSVAGTDQPPIGCSDVEISVSVDRGETFEYVLTAQTPNSGSAIVEPPPVIENNAIVRVMCATGIFLADATVSIDGTQCSSDNECSDGDPCNGEEQCVGIACVAGTPLNCDNGAFCDGEEQCDSALGCVPGEPLDLDDGIECTSDACDEIEDRIVHLPDNASCDDDLFCNGDEQCVVGVGCTEGVSPAIAFDDACQNATCDEATDTVSVTTLEDCPGSSSEDEGCAAAVPAIWIAVLPTRRWSRSRGSQRRPTQ